MKILVKRVDKKLPLPKYETDGSLGFDFLARQKTLVPPKSISLIPSNLIVKVPKGYLLAVISRSSTPRKKNLLTPHGLGIIDHDYHGPDDEILIQVFNFSNEEVVIERGERIAQGVLIRADKFDFEESDKCFKQDSRGGLGSTG